MVSNLAEQLQKLVDIKRESPTASHVYVKRTDMNDSIVDIPMHQVEKTLRIHPNWEVMMSSQQMNREVEALFEDDKTHEEQKPITDDGSEEVQMVADEQVVHGLNDDTPPLPPKPSAKKPRKAAKRVVTKKTDETA